MRTTKAIVTDEQSGAEVASYTWSVHLPVEIAAARAMRRVANDRDITVRTAECIFLVDVQYNNIQFPMSLPRTLVTDIAEDR